MFLYLTIASQGGELWAHRLQYRHVGAGGDHICLVSIFKKNTSSEYFLSNTSCGYFFITHLRYVSIFKPLIKSFFCGPIRLTESRLRRLDLEGGRINQAILLMLAITWFWYFESFFSFFCHWDSLWHTSVNMALNPCETWSHAHSHLIFKTCNTSPQP